MMELKLLVLLTVANGAPVLGQTLLGQRFDLPLDGGLRLGDGRPLLGRSKTLRGLLLALLCTPAAAAILGLSWSLGAELALYAMLGDVLSSFTKRRLNIDTSARAPGLDQLPESLLPLLLLGPRLGLGLWSIVGTAVAFTVLEMAISPLLFRLHIRQKPY
jgi:hypothetical protein